MVSLFMFGVFIVNPCQSVGRKVIEAIFEISTCESEVISSVVSLEIDSVGFSLSVHCSMGDSGLLVDFLK